MANKHELTDPLSEREEEILACLMEGLSNREIAARLYLTYQTVKWYNSQIYSKLNVSNRDDAVARAIELGLLKSKADAPKLEGKHNLPRSATEFVGRHQELQELQQLVDAIRLITILAPGGIGKTRLSLAVAGSQIGQYDDGVYFVPLAPLSSPNDIVTTLAENIGFVFHGEIPPQQQLVNFLKDRTMLLVLDNFEHLLEGAGLVSDIIQSTSEITVMVTSRERLNLRGEHVYHLRGLQFPTWETPEDALEYDAVKLFVQSARRVRTRFELQPDELAYLARICRLTAGMPLGLELAAGWVDVLPLDRIASEIQKGIDILETDMRDVPERHRSLRATFERTWNRLTDEEQQVFARLSVFRGGFTLDAAEAVADAHVRHLRQLAQKTLIQIEAHDRYGIHELLRQFAEDKLMETEECPLVQQKHATYFADFMSQRKRDIKSERELEALELIASHFENIRVAWFYLVDEGEWEQLSGFLYGLFFYCNMRMRGQDALELSEYAVNRLKAAPVTDRIEQVLGHVSGLLAWAYKDVGLLKEGRAIGLEALSMVRQFDDAEAFFETIYCSLGASFIARDFYHNQVEGGRRLAQATGDTYWGFLLHSNLISLLHTQGKFVEALQVAEQIQNAFPDLQNRWSHFDEWVARAYEAQEQYDRAIYYFKKHLVKAIKLGNIKAMALVHSSLGDVQRKQEHFIAAHSHLKQSLRLFTDIGYQWTTPVPLQLIAHLLADQNQLELAVEILATIDPHLVSTFQTDQKAQALRAELEARMARETFEAAWQRGQDREMRTLIDEVLLKNKGDQTR